MFNTYNSTIFIVFPMIDLEILVIFKLNVVQVGFGWSHQVV